MKIKKTALGRCFGRYQGKPAKGNQSYILITEAGQEFI